jgi:hypothetical protein
LQESEAKKAEKERRLLLAKITELNKRIPWMAKLEAANQELKRLSNIHEFLLLKARIDSIDGAEVILCF